MNTILIIDPDMANCQKLTREFTSLGWDCCVVACLDEGLAMLKEKDFSYVISEIFEDDCSGQSVVECLKKAAFDISVYIYTNHDCIQTTVAYIKAGAEDYLLKSETEAEELRAIISRFQKKKATAAQLNSTQITGMPAVSIGDEASSSKPLEKFPAIRILGKGACGFVYLTRDSHQDYALKILKPELLSSDNSEEYKARFTLEASVLSELDHKNIIKVHKHGIQHGGSSLYMLMDYFPGKKLNEWLTPDCPWNYQDKIAILLQLAEATAYLHSQNKYHRDIKPENILVDEQGHLKLIDFGLVMTDQFSITRRDAILGTPNYLSPEGFSSSRIDARSDIFAIGVTAYEFLLGQRPFDGKSLMHLTYSIQTSTPPEPRSLEKNFPRELQRILNRCLKASPEERYRNSLELVHDLKAYLKQGRMQKIVNCLSLKQPAWKR